MEGKEGKQIELTLNFIFMSSRHCEARHLNVELEPGKGPARSIYRRGRKGCEYNQVQRRGDRRNQTTNLSSRTSLKERISLETIG